MLATTLLIGGLILSACSIPGAMPAADPTATADGAITSFQDARKAVVRVVAAGGFEDPDDVQGYAAGFGTAFIIEETGIAVTTNRAVSGAATVKVFFDGETDGKERSATVLGSSECADLALIDLEGEGYPALQWADSEPAADDEIYALGYPVDTARIAVRRGTISNVDIAAQTPWLSQRSVLQLNAQTEPGSVGGPIVDADGRVVGTQMLGNGSRRFALDRAVVEPLLERLRARENVEALGINPLAFIAGETTGIWVSAVRTRSPAGALGIEAGDVILDIENLAMGADGNLADYCGILRSREASDVLSVRVFRPATGEVLEGEFNGDELVVVDQIAADEPTAVPEPEPEPEPTAEPAPEPTKPLIVATPLPEPVEPSAGLAVRPGTLTLQDYEAQVGGMRQLIFETFDRGNRTRAIWSEYDGETSAAALRDNVYALTVKRERNTGRQLWSEQRLGATYNVELAVAFETTGQPASIGIAFDDQGDSGDLSVFEIFNNKTWKLTTFRGGAQSPELSTDALPAPMLADGVGVNLLWIVRTPTETQFWLNSQHVATIDSSAFDGGFVGISFSGWAGLTTPVTILTDNFRVRQG
jgi:S1-C subfamily serine protease